MKTTSNRENGCRYSLRRGLNAWELKFAGANVVLRHEQGLLYVAYLLYHPGPEALHGQELQLRSWHPATGGKAGLVLQRSAGVDEAKDDRARFRKRLELESLVDDPSEPEPVRLEAQRELEAICEYQNRNLHHTRDNARRAAEAVRKAIRRLHGKLVRAVDTAGRPHPVLRSFAQHLEDCILRPSRWSKGRRLGASSGSGCCFRYYPPPGVVWGDGTPA